MNNRTFFAKATSLFLQSKKSDCKLSQRFYRAAVIKEYGKPFVIEEQTKELHIGHKEVLVRVKSAGINFADLRMVQGTHHIKAPLPFIPGFEFAGDVESIGKSVKNFAVGDRVLGYKALSTGAFAEKCAVKEKELYKLPHSLSYEIAASLPYSYCTAYHALNDVAKATEGEKVLVLTAQGSIGVAAIDLALSVFRCQVIVGSDTDEKLAVVRPSGVLATVLWTSEDLINNVRKHTDNLGVDIIIDTVGGSDYNQALSCLKPGGQILSLGFSSGQIPTMNAETLMKHRASVSGVSLGAFVQRNPADFHNMLETILGLIDEEIITPHIKAKFDFEKINDAFDFVKKKTWFGKVILNIP